MCSNANLRWKELDEHFSGLEKSFKRRFHEMEDQEKEFETKKKKAQEMVKKRESTVVVKEQASLVRLQEKRDVTLVEKTTSSLFSCNLTNEACSLATKAASRFCSISCAFFLFLSRIPFLGLLTHGSVTSKTFQDH
ncbi:hypothetical protein GOBAR_DD00441 [Gossypium barbadense]|nr:hypothetical protein GOBAR_DD00441 [Gossypium barbadense]